MQVSWVKQSGEGDGQVKLLTFGLHTYSQDTRLSINFEQPDDWKLRIQGVEKADGGAYACQVSSHPPQAMGVNLTVIGKQIYKIRGQTTS